MNYIGIQNISYPTNSRRGMTITIFSILQKVCHKIRRQFFLTQCEYTNFTMKSLVGEK